MNGDKLGENNLNKNGDSEQNQKQLSAKKYKRMYFGMVLYQARIDYWFGRITIVVVVIGELWFILHAIQTTDHMTLASRIVLTLPLNTPLAMYIYRRTRQTEKAARNLYICIAVRDMIESIEDPQQKVEAYWHAVELLAKLESEAGVKQLFNKDKDQNTSNGH